ncbi:MAG: helix-turn-helix transcriptional regulator [Desulfobacteraceae bacterium]|nr:helix-turn-helix transcriptional regulator [Desulfobacteraceae bacterium]
MNTIIRIESIAQVHDIIGYKSPKHPLITLIEPEKMKQLKIPIMNYQVISSLYAVSLKNGQECQILYGRQHYDFQEGTLMFMAPEQTVMPIKKSDVSEKAEWNGWVLLFHPDLIRKSSLVNKMNGYTFFNYDSHEALHISEKERYTVTDIVKTIEHEYSQNMDDFSKELIVSNIELLLNYCKRFYGRQFITRSNVNKDLVMKFEAFITAYFESDKLESNGLLSVKQCAKEMGYSANYLSDLLKRETGKNTQEHIHYSIIEKGRNLLVSTNEPINQIAYALGFDYPQHFSKLFKTKTGMSPAEYRN